MESQNGQPASQREISRPHFEQAAFGWLQTPNENLSLSLSLSLQKFFPFLQTPSKPG
jgi:hypothetical protein